MSWIWGRWSNHIGALFGDIVVWLALRNSQFRLNSYTAYNKMNYVSLTLVLVILQTNNRMMATRNVSTNNNALNHLHAIHTTHNIMIIHAQFHTNTFQQQFSTIIIVKWLLILIICFQHSRFRVNTAGNMFFYMVNITFKYRSASSSADHCPLVPPSSELGSGFLQPRRLRATISVSA